MTARTIDDLYESLFDTIDGVKSGALAPDKAKIIGDISQVIVNAAKVQVEFRRVKDDAEARFLKPVDELAKLPSGILGVRRHLLKDD